MTESILLYFFLSVAFVLAPLMTNYFFLNNSKVYSEGHKLALLLLLFGAVLNLNYLAVVWPLFCAFGFFLYLKKDFKFLFSLEGFATGIPFVFSLISATWFFSGLNDLHLLGYNQAWSFYAALHGSFLGWMFVGCLAYLSTRPNSSKLYLWVCYLIFVLFLCVAFGIDGVPYVKRIGVVGLSLLVPMMIGKYTFSLKKENSSSRYLAGFSLLSIMAAMALAVLNEFWVDVPRVAFGIPIMVLVHGFINAVFTLPCFFLAIRLERDQSSNRVSTEQSVVFFDDVCVLCIGSVSSLIKHDKNRMLKYSSLQGKYAKGILDLRHVETSASVIFRNEGVSYERAEAVIHILIKLGGLYKLLGMILKIFPLFILNGTYDLVARNRYQIFGKKDSCLIPTEDVKNLFIP